MQEHLPDRHNVDVEQLALLECVECGHKMCKDLPSMDEDLPPCDECYSGSRVLFVAHIDEDCRQYMREHNEPVAAISR